MNINNLLLPLLLLSVAEAGPLQREEPQHERSVDAQSFTRSEAHELTSHIKTSCIRSTIACMGTITTPRGSCRKLLATGLRKHDGASIEQRRGRSAIFFFDTLIRSIDVDHLECYHLK